MTISKGLVLLVEDDPDDARLTLMALEETFKPYEVAVARDGVEALEFLLGTGAHAGRNASEKPVLIVLDINLPRISGIQLLERLKQEWGPDLSNVNIAVLSSSYMEQERNAVKNLGAKVHLRKPISSEESAVMVREIGLLLPQPGPFPPPAAR